MRIEQIDLKIVRLPLVRPFQTSSSRKDCTSTTSWSGSWPTARSAGASAPARPIPYYCPETTETCWHILKDFLGSARAGSRMVEHRRAGARSIDS